MKKMLNTLYITTPERYLSLDGENIVVLNGRETVARFPLHNIEGVITFGYQGASPALMGACAKRNVPICFLSKNGSFLARVSGETVGSVLLRKQQYRLSDSLSQSNRIAKNFLIGKIYNSKWVLERAIRDYPLVIDTGKFKAKTSFLSAGLKRLASCKSLEELRGVEGEAASVYFSVFDDLILQQKEDFYFRTRNRRPPTDNINAMLSFAYVLLANMCRSALETVGLDPYVGFLHRDRPGRASLALDLTEEFRSVFADRFVLTLTNKRMVKAKDFMVKENGAVIMGEEARKTFLSAWQTRKQEIITHPFLNEKLQWGMVPYVQALLLARFLRGDLEEYPPFMWK